MKKKEEQVPLGNVVLLAALTMLGGVRSVSTTKKCGCKKCNYEKQQINK